MQRLRGGMVPQHVAQNGVAWPTVRPCPRAGLESPVCRADNVARRGPYGQIKSHIHVAPLNSAATAAWRVNTPASFISEILSAADYQHVALIRAHGDGRCVVVIFVRMPRRARGRAINNLIAWPYGRAGVGVAPVVLCKHSFLHGLLSFS